MTDPPLDPHERELAERLVADRPVPGARFRGMLGRRLSAADPGYRPRPERLRAIAAAYVCAGVALAGIGALQALGVL